MTPAPVTYFIQVPLTGRDRQRFAIDDLQHAGFTVRVVDFGPFLLPNLPADRNHYGSLGDLTPVVVSDRAGIDRVMAELKESGGLVVCLIAGRTIVPAAAGILRRLGRLGVPYIQFLNVQVPGIARADGVQKKSIPSRLLHFLRSGNILRSLHGRIPLRFLGVPCAAAALYGGRLSKGGRLIGPTTQAIAAHASDWEQVRTARNRAADERPVAVFLDQFLPFHPDFTETGGRPPDPALYFNSLRRLFDRIERELGLEVVIAAHPRADYHVRGGELFGKRRLVIGDTAGLIRDSRLVVAHYSSAIGLAAAFLKPVLLVGSKDVWSADPVILRMAEGYAQTLRRPLWSLDAVDSIDLTMALDVDKPAYAGFVENYLKMPGSPDGSLGEILIEALTRQFPEVCPRSLMVRSRQPAGVPSEWISARGKPPSP
ncbi:hypothetical protein [Magnetospirillum aberrantis]|uniref:Uncharacterized protein n=1 Tax=Magnetospirillum aberrantis SpK TaxID=908842 RepID=A0A7C9QRL9_9PROT|nr:hypothetical protein [Magnetospirillum aberrantis]NFV78557.1 hypothetical protein [Magnetospirillum aberrantis SpK]